MTLSKKPERDCDSMEVTLFNRGWNAAIDATTPPAAQRQWVGLTPTDRKQIEKKYVFVEDAIRLTEAKLKEKNT